jgi:hypothetical protein
MIIEKEQLCLLSNRFDNTNPLPMIASELENDISITLLPVTKSMYTNFFIFTKYSHSNNIKGYEFLSDIVILCFITLLVISE